MDLAICRTVESGAILNGEWKLEDGGKLSAEVTTNFGRIVFGERVAYPEREEFVIYREWTPEKTDQSDQFVILGGAAYRTGKIVPAEVTWSGTSDKGYFMADERVLIDVLGPPPTT
jgi:hypothetical protein